LSRFVTTLCRSGASAALHLIERKNFDIVFSGIAMPGALDGAALANAIQARTP
jgi:DNA-binding LytR/AlgR family response regulator